MDDDGSSMAASVKFCEKGVGAGGFDIKLAGELVEYVPDGIGAYLLEPCLRYKLDKPLALGIGGTVDMVLPDEGTCEVGASGGIMFWGGRLA